MKSVDYDQPTPFSDGAFRMAQAWASTPGEQSPAEQQAAAARIRTLLAERNAVMVAHYYVDGALQELARETGGCVGDSLEMARFGATHPATTLLVAGVRFMGETAKILSPDKQVLMPDLDATCSLDLGCPADAFSAFCDAHPDRTVVVYANTSAAVKARADWVVTSSVGRDIVAHLHAQGEKILWAPDRHLGAYIQAQTGADMLLWQGSCVVHDEFKADELGLLMQEYPQAAVLVHPESPASVAGLAHVVGSTTQLIDAAGRMPNPRFIVASDQGHPARDACALSRQDLHGGAHGWAECLVQKLCLVSVDGHERLDWRRAGAATRHGLHRSGPAHRRTSAQATGTHAGICGTRQAGRARQWRSGARRPAVSALRPGLSSEA